MRKHLASAPVVVGSLKNGLCLLCKVSEASPEFQKQQAGEEPGVGSSLVIGLWDCKAYMLKKTTHQRKA